VTRTVFDAIPSSQVDAGCAALERRKSLASPTAGTSLSGSWKLVYTTEKDVHPFLLRKVLGLPVTRIWQDIDMEEGRLINGIDLAAGLAIRAGAPVEVQSNKRIAYFFDWVMVKLGPLQLKFPLKRGPGGWTEAAYLDEDLRVMRNFRRDLLVLVRDDE